MARLSDLQLASLLDEIACAMRVGTPIAESMRRLNDRRLGPVASASAMIAEALERGESLSASVGSIASPMSAQAAAAIQACQQQGGEAKLLGRMAELLRQRSEYSRMFRLAWLYPLLLLVVGYAIGVSIMGPMILRFQGHDVAWPAWLFALAEWSDSNWQWPLIVMLALLVMVAAWLVSRNRFPRDVRMRLFCQSLADQLTHDVPEDVAIATAAKMSGEGSLESIVEPTLRAPELGKILSKGGSTDIPGIGQADALVARLRYTASVYGERARRHSHLWSRLLPRLAMVVIGGGLIISYAWWVIAPVYRQVAMW